MKVITSPLFRAIVSVAVGVLLINNAENTLKVLTILVGIMFLLAGAISCTAYYNDRIRRRERPKQEDGLQKAAKDELVMPVVAMGSLVFGFLMALEPMEFHKLLMYILAAIVILAAVNQIALLINVSKAVRLSAWFWVLPALLLLAGLFVLVRPLAVEKTMFVILGVALIVFGLSEVGGMLLQRKARKAQYVSYGEVNSDK